MVTAAAGGKVIICTSLSLGTVVVVLVLPRRLRFQLLCLVACKTGETASSHSDAAQLIPSLVNACALKRTTSRLLVCNICVTIQGPTQLCVYLFFISV